MVQEAFDNSIYKQRIVQNMSIKRTGTDLTAWIGTDGYNWYKNI